MLLLVMMTTASLASADDLFPGWTESAADEEQIRWIRLERGIRVFLNARRDASRVPRTLILYATPNGSSASQALGAAESLGVDWRFQNQHVMAQVRMLRALCVEREWMLAVVQAPELSWPAFRKNDPTAGPIISRLVDQLRVETECEDVVLTCHSGGGALVWEFLNQHPTIPAWISRIVLLDANYSYSDEAGHGDKLLEWLMGDVRRRLVVIAYDDRMVELNGRRVVSDDGGTWRASERMLSRIGTRLPLAESDDGPVRVVTAADGRVQVLLHRNPDNIILHTRLVGEMNGLLHSLTLGQATSADWGRFTGPFASGDCTPLKPFVVDFGDQARVVESDVAVLLPVSDRSVDAAGGQAVAERVAELDRGAREAVIEREILSGNLPQRLRELVPVQFVTRDTQGAAHTVVVFVTGDVLGAGSNDDWVRWPLTPSTAVRIADTFNCCLLTPLLSDVIYSAATTRVAPVPLTENRESAATFVMHDATIDRQLAESDARLVAGIKKDVVLSRRLLERPHRVAIYGWHQIDGTPIQPINVSHVDSYVDYSHGVRLVARQVLVDGQRRDFLELAQDAVLHPLVSGEGPVSPAQIRQSSQW